MYFETRVSHLKRFNVYVSPFSIIICWLHTCAFYSCLNISWKHLYFIKLTVKFNQTSKKGSLLHAHHKRCETVEVMNGLGVVNANIVI